MRCLLPWTVRLAILLGLAAPALARLDRDVFPVPGLRDPISLDRLRPDYASGDHLHPNAAGYRRMGEMIDVRLFK